MLLQSPREALQKNAKYALISDRRDELTSAAYKKSPAIEAEAEGTLMTEDEGRPIKKVSEQKAREKKAKHVKGRDNDRTEPLNPRIIQGLHSLYDGIVNDPLPDKLTDLLDQLREQERQLQPGQTTTKSVKGNDGDD